MERCEILLQEIVGRGYLNYMPHYLRVLDLLGKGDKKIEVCKEFYDTEHKFTALELGNAYKNGQLVEKDLCLFNRFYTEAFKHGISYAKYLVIINDYSLNDPDVDKGIVEALHSWEKEPNARAWLGRCFVQGRGVEKDLEKGKKLLQDAYSNGIKWAKDFLEKTD